MAENILTEPLLQNAELSVAPGRVVVLPAGTWTPICGTDPQRLCLTVIPGTAGTMPFVSPVNYGSAGFGSTGTVAAPLVIHGSVYPLLIAGVWYALSIPGDSVTVLETVRIRG